MERFQPQYQQGLWESQKGPWLYWCDSGLWRWVSGWGPQSAPGGIKSLLQRYSGEKQAQPPLDLYERRQGREYDCNCGFPLQWRGKCIPGTSRLFLALASDLKLKGLMSTDEAEQEKADIASFQPTTNRNICPAEKIKWWQRHRQ